MWGAVTNQRPSPHLRLDLYFRDVFRSTLTRDDRGKGLFPKGQDLPHSMTSRTAVSTTMLGMNFRGGVSKWKSRRSSGFVVYGFVEILAVKTPRGLRALEDQPSEHRPYAAEPHR